MHCKKPYTKLIQFKLDPSTLEMLDFCAKSMQTTRSDYIRAALNESWRGAEKTIRKGIAIANQPDDYKEE